MTNNMYFYTSTCMHTYIHTYIYIYICTHIYIYTYTYTYTHACMHACLSFCLSVCLSVHDMYVSRGSSASRSDPSLPQAKRSQQVPLGVLAARLRDRAGFLRESSAAASAVARAKGNSLGNRQNMVGISQEFTYLGPYSSVMFLLSS